MEPAKEQKMLHYARSPIISATLREPSLQPFGPAKIEGTPSPNEKIPSHYYTHTKNQTITQIPSFVPKQVLKPTIISALAPQEDNYVTFIDKEQYDNFLLKA